jgi:hypothetical protein
MHFRSLVNNVDEGGTDSQSYLATKGAEEGDDAEKSYDIAEGDDIEECDIVKEGHDSKKGLDCLEESDRLLCGDHRRLETRCPEKQGCALLEKVGMIQWLE